MNARSNATSLFGYPDMICPRGGFSVKDGKIRVAWKSLFKNGAEIKVKGSIDQLESGSGNLFFSPWKIKASDVLSQVFLVKMLETYKALEKSLVAALPKDDTVKIPNIVIRAISADGSVMAMEDTCSSLLFILSKSAVLSDPQLMQIKSKLLALGTAAPDAVNSLIRVEQLPECDAKLTFPRITARSSSPALGFGRFHGSRVSDPSFEQFHTSRVTEPNLEQIHVNQPILDTSRVSEPNFDQFHTARLMEPYYQRSLLSRYYE